MFENLEKLIRLHDLEITIMEERYGDGLLLGLDIPRNPAHLSQRPIHDLIDQATSPGDMDAIEALCRLAELAEEYPAFLYVCADSLEEGLRKLDERAERWNGLSQEEQGHILEKVNELHSKAYVSNLDYLLSQPNTYEAHSLAVTGDADTYPLLEVTTETDFQYDFKLGQELMVVIHSKRAIKGILSFFDDESLKLRKNGGIEVCIPFEVITHIVDK